MTTNELYGIYSVWHVPFWQTTWFFWLLVGIGLIIVSVGIGLYIRCVQRRRALRTPWQEALIALEQLGVSTMQPDQGKEFYVQLICILKKYLQARYSISVLEKTDQELVFYMEKLDVLKDVYVPLRQVIEGGTLIKFANVQTLQKQMECDLERTISFIKQTMPVQQ